MRTGCLPGWRTGKADREYDGLSAAKGVKVIMPGMNRPSVPNRNRSPYFLQSTTQRSKWKKQEGREYCSYIQLNSTVSTHLLLELNFHGRKMGGEIKIMKVWHIVLVTSEIMSDHI